VGVGVVGDVGKGVGKWVVATVTDGDSGIACDKGVVKVTAAAANAAFACCYAAGNHNCGNK
jgi:hypothetical protein